MLKETPYQIIFAPTEVCKNCRHNKRDPMDKKDSPNGDPVIHIWEYLEKKTFHN